MTGLAPLAAVPIFSYSNTLQTNADNRQNFEWLKYTLPTGKNKGRVEKYYEKGIKTGRLSSTAPDGMPSKAWKSTKTRFRMSQTSFSGLPDVHKSESTTKMYLIMP